jgi:hypothetical protein
LKQLQQIKFFSFWSVCEIHKPFCLNLILLVDTEIGERATLKSQG